MANTIKRGESLFIPFKNGESIYDSQLKPRMYKTKEQYDRFSYHFKDAEMVEYAEVVQCKKCWHYNEVTGKDSGKPCGYGICKNPSGLCGIIFDEYFCSYGERREGE